MVAISAEDLLWAVAPSRPVSAPLAASVEGFRQLLDTRPGTRRSSFDHFTEYVFDTYGGVGEDSEVMFSFQDHYTLSPFPFQLVLELGPGLKCVLGGDRKECIMICKLIQGRNDGACPADPASKLNVCSFCTDTICFLQPSMLHRSNSVSVEKLHILKQGVCAGATLGNEPLMELSTAFDIP